MKTSFEKDVGSKNADVEFYNGTDGHKDRLGVITKDIHVEFNHLVEYEEKKSYYKCLSKRDDDGNITTKGYCCSKSNDALPRFGMPVCQYLTKPDGELKKPFSWTVKAWTYRQDKWNQLKGLSKKWGDLTQRDIEVSCVGEGKYQKMTITPYPEAVWSKNDSIKAEILAEATKVDELIPRFLGRNATEEDYKKMYGEPADKGTVAGVGSSVNLDDLLS